MISFEGEVVAYEISAEGSRAGDGRGIELAESRESREVDLVKPGEYATEPGIA